MQGQFECKCRSKPRSHIQFISKEGKIHRCSPSLFHKAIVTWNQWNLCFFTSHLHLCLHCPGSHVQIKVRSKCKNIFFPFLLPALVLAFCIFMVHMCIPCVCIISVNHKWGSCLYCISQLKSMVHDDKLSIDFFFYCLLTCKLMYTPFTPFN